MSTIQDRVIIILRKKPSLSDREITNIILGPNANQQYINQACRALEMRRNSEGDLTLYVSICRLQNSSMS